MSADSRTDYEIIHAVLNGDKNAYAVIIDRYQNFVFSLVGRLIPDREDVKDIVQEIFIKTYFALPQYNIKYEFKSWLYKIALNYILDFIRGKNYRDKIISFENIETIEDNSFGHKIVEVEIELDEKIKKLEKAINKLKLKYKEVILLRYIEKLKVEEIAEVLSISCNTAKVRLHRGIKKLKKIFENL